MKRHGSTLCAALILSLFTSNAFAALSTPAGLSPGDHFHWAFVTSTSRDATSSDIADYNAFVNSAADAASLTPSGIEAGGGDVTALGDIDWKAIASTVDVDARDNIGDPTSPIYRLDGVQVAADEAALWNSINIDLLAPINVDETLTSVSTLVWTGTGPSGLGSHELGGLSTVFSVGDTNQIGPNWITSSQGNPTFLYPLYAISEELTVGEAQVIPLPGSVVLGLIGLMSSSMALSGKKRRPIDPSRNGAA